MLSRFKKDISVYFKRTPLMRCKNHRTTSYRTARDFYLTNFEHSLYHTDASQCPLKIELHINVCTKFGL